MNLVDYPCYVNKCYSKWKVNDLSKLEEYGFVSWRDDLDGEERRAYEKLVTGESYPKYVWRNQNFHKNYEKKFKGENLKGEYKTNYEWVPTQFYWENSPKHEKFLMKPKDDKAFAILTDPLIQISNLVWVDNDDYLNVSFWYMDADSKNPGMGTRFETMLSQEVMSLMLRMASSGLLSEVFRGGSPLVTYKVTEKNGYDYLKAFDVSPNPHCITVKRPPKNNNLPELPYGIKLEDVVPKEYEVTLDGVFLNPTVSQSDERVQIIDIPVLFTKVVEDPDNGYHYTQAILYVDNAWVILPYMLISEPVHSPSFRGILKKYNIIPNIFNSMEFSVYSSSCL